MAEHGTYARAAKHQRDGEALCEPCRLAKNAYQSAYFKKNPEKRNHGDMSAYIEARRQSRRDILNRYKMWKGCEFCGYRESPHALDFDHIDPAQKEAQVSNMLTGSRKRLIAEVRKCRVLCANCHRIHTNGL